jgi:tetratricopeptide (TPR) repeat protein
MFAPKHEKEFVKAIGDYAAGHKDRALEHFKRAVAADTKGRAVADDLMAGLLLVESDNEEAAIPYLEAVVRSDLELPDDVMLKYGVGGQLVIGVTDRVRVEVDWSSLGAALILVECYQAVGRRDEAIGLLQQLSEVDVHPGVILSMCELLSEENAWDEIVEIASGVTNEDDITLETRLMQAQAFREQGRNEAALEAYKDALRSTKRDPELLKEARYERGKLLIAIGKVAQGKKDLEKVYAQDSGYADVASLLNDG